MYPCLAEIWIRKNSTDVSSLEPIHPRHDNNDDEFDAPSVVYEVLCGKSRIALAITEPDAGSDVKGLQTEARLSEDGAYLIINGHKKVGYSNLFVTF